MELNFRLITTDDLPSMLKWGKHYDPRLEHYSFTDFDLDDIRTWYHAKQKFLTRKLFGLVAVHTVVGFITLKKINFIYRTAEIGLAVNPDEFGKGYGTRLIRSLLAHVFSAFPIDTIFLDVAKFNVNARRLYEKCGFMYVGEELKPYENQSNIRLVSDFSDDFVSIENRIYTKFLRMSYQKGTLSETAPAKINFGLRVVGRHDGYHDLVTTMVTADFADIVHVRINKKVPGIRILSRHDGIEEHRNLCYKAAQLFLDNVEFVNEECREKCIEIAIYKRIPEGAGMGGGSADAAAVLRALNQLFGNPFENNQLRELALKLGSDVPFCIGGGAAIAMGRGERLEHFRIEKPLHILVYPPSAKLSTAAVFAEYDRLMPKDSVSENEAYAEAISLRELIGKTEIPFDPTTACAPDAHPGDRTSSHPGDRTTDHGVAHPTARPTAHDGFDYARRRVTGYSMSHGIGYGTSYSVGYGNLYSNIHGTQDVYMSIYEKLIRTIPPNDLEAATQSLLDGNDGDLKHTPAYAIRLLKENGAVYAAMSGSGPGVYGIFESEYDAKRAQKKMPQSIYSFIKNKDSSK